MKIDFTIERIRAYIMDILRCKEGDKHKTYVVDSVLDIVCDNATKISQKYRNVTSGHIENLCCIMIFNPQADCLYEMELMYYYNISNKLYRQSLPKKIINLSYFSQNGQREFIPNEQLEITLLPTELKELLQAYNKGMQGPKEYKDIIDDILHQQISTIQTVAVIDHIFYYQVIALSEQKSWEYLFTNILNIPKPYSDSLYSKRYVTITLKEE